MSTRNNAGNRLAGVLSQSILRDGVIRPSTLAPSVLEPEPHTRWPSIPATTLISSIRPSESISSASGGRHTASPYTMTDARIVALPVRVSGGVFVWVTCGLVLERLERDAFLTGVDLPFSWPECAIDHVLLSHESPVGRQTPGLSLGNLDFFVERAEIGAIAHWIAAELLPIGEGFDGFRRRFERSLALLADEDFAYFAEQRRCEDDPIGLGTERRSTRCLAPPETLFQSMIVRTNPDDQSCVQKELDFPQMITLGADGGSCALRIASAP